MDSRIVVDNHHILCAVTRDTGGGIRPWPSLALDFLDYEGVVGSVLGSGQMRDTFVGGMGRYVGLSSDDGSVIFGVKVVWAEALGGVVFVLSQPDPAQL